MRANEMELLELVLEIAADVAINVAMESGSIHVGDDVLDSFYEQKGNKDYTGQKLLDDIKAGKDIYEVNYEKDVYKELKEMYRKKSISKYEYEKLVEHQKSIDQFKEKLIHIQKLLQEDSVECREYLINFKEDLNNFYEAGKIDFEKYTNVLNAVNDKINHINQVLR